MDEDNDAGRWMTFTELSEVRGISRASASKLVRRRKWRRQTDNHGTVRILVPPDAAASPSDGPTVSLPDSSKDRPSDSPSDTSRAISTLEAAIAVLQEQLERANSRAETAETRADRAEQGREGERARADALRDRIEVMAADLAAARGAENRARAETDLLARKVNELTTANDARRARGLLARLRAAWRGD